MSIDWTKPLRVKGQGWPVEVISDKGRRPGFPMLCYVNNQIDITSFSRNGWNEDAYYQLENVPPEKQYAIQVSSSQPVSGPYSKSFLTELYESKVYKIFELVETTLDKVKKEAE